MGKDKLTELGKQEGPKCSWMFGDAGTGWGVIGLGGVGNKLAHLNPARWSQKSTMAVAQEMLEQVDKDDKERVRPITLKVFEEGKETKQEQYENVAKTIDQLKAVTAKQAPELQALEKAKVDAENRAAAAQEHFQKEKKAYEQMQKKAKDKGAYD